MKKIIVFILSVLAVLNLIWLFVFDYKVPGFLLRYGNHEDQSAYIEEALPAEGDENAGAEALEEIGIDEEQETLQEAYADGDETIEEAPGEAVGTCHPSEGNAPNIRSGPGSNYEIVGAADNDEVLIVRGAEEEGWLPIRTEDGVEGYVFAGLVIIDGQEE